MDYPSITTVRFKILTPRDSDEHPSEWIDHLVGTKVGLFHDETEADALARARRNRELYRWTVSKASKKPKYAPGSLRIVRVETVERFTEIKD